MSAPRLTGDERLALLVRTQREIAAAGGDLQRVMQLVAERSEALTGAPLPPLHAEDVVAALDAIGAGRDGPLTDDDRAVLEMLSGALGAAISRAAERDARHAEAQALGRLRTLLDAASIGIVQIDADGSVAEVNPALEQMLERSADAIVGGRLSDHLVSEDRTAVDAMVQELLGGERTSFELDTRCRTIGGALIWWHVRAVAEREEHGRPACVLAMIDDISERKHAEAELARQAALSEHQALHDPLTELPNRLLFGERIDQAIRYARRDGTRLGVLLMDLDRFKDVNDTLGHAAGDELLVQVAARIAGVLRDSDTFARLGGDEFGLLLPGLTVVEDIEPVLARIRAALEQPAVVHGLPLAVEASIGAAIFPGDGEDAQVLIQRADAAMYEAKREGSAFCLYEHDAHHHDVERLTLIGELRRAIEQGELVLHYQPKALLAGGEVRSVEALVRWQHPVRGLLYPDAFIPLAQETSLIGPLTLHVIELALGQARGWRDAGRELAVSVNLSMRNLLDQELPRQVGDLLVRFGMPPASLELEVTESSMLANPRRAKTVLAALSALGVRLSIDDFGTGFSSLCYLREMPVDEIKIDRSFVMRMSDESHDAAIVRSTIDLGRSLGLDVVAEGVETQEIWDQLRELGCQIAQGYFLSRPVPPEQLTEWLHRHEQPPPAEPSARLGVAPGSATSTVMRGAA